MKSGRIFTASATIVAFLLVMTTAVAWNISTNDIIMIPAPALAIDSRVSVAGHPQQPHRGALYITFVDEPQANILTKLWYSHFDANATIVPLQAYYPTGIPSQAQQQKISIQEMLTSKQQAQLAAFNALGYSVQGEQVAVDGVEPQSKAAGKLHKDDIILQVNGRQVLTPQQLRQEVQRLQPGDLVSLLVSRSASGGASHTFRLTFPTIRSTSTGTTAIGIYPRLTFSAMPKDLPYKVSIASDNIGGPSAGLMFTLAIINRLSKTDLTHGHKIAGTGEIDAAGDVGPIGGAKQKIIGAQEAGAQYFIVPIDNYAEAKPYAKHITLVPVRSLDDALTFLQHLH